MMAPGPAAAVSLGRGRQMQEVSVDHVEDFDSPPGSLYS
jgi:hypothetical protein